MMQIIINVVILINLMIKVFPYFLWPSAEEVFTLLNPLVVTSLFCSQNGLQ